MTDKQIIIDGIDVSFCTHHYNGWSNLHRDTRPMCEIGYDRECEPKHFECSHYVKCLEQQLKRKEQECEELKEVNQELLKYRKHSTTCQECYEDGLEDGKTSNKELRKLRKTLTEIKEIINEFAKEDILTFPDFSKEKNYELIQKQCGEPILKILQKINEVENEN